MPYQKKAYLEHSAIRVKDIDWHIRFFKEALNMSIRKMDGEKITLDKYGLLVEFN
ncbi:hypothetical protein MUB15_13305 [Priestia sp. OVS21]|nr:hypothetical protein [Priestia sp. OVS21]